jgi:hypothetical protein
LFQYNHSGGGEDRPNGHTDFGGGEDDVTSAAVGLVLDSLDDIHCLLEAKHQVIILMHSYPAKQGVS